MDRRAVMVGGTGIALALALPHHSQPLKDADPYAILVLGKANGAPRTLFTAAAKDGAGFWLTSVGTVFQVADGVDEVWYYDLSQPGRVIDSGNPIPDLLNKVRGGMLIVVPPATPEQAARINADLATDAYPPPFVITG